MTSALRRKGLAKIKMRQPECGKKGLKRSTKSNIICRRHLRMAPQYALSALDGHIGESPSHFELGTLTYFLSVAFAINRTPMSSNLLLLLHLRLRRRRLDPSSQTPSSFHSTPDRIFAKRTQSSQHHFDAQCLKAT